MIVALLFCLVLGLSLLVSVLHAHFRDVEPVLAAALLPWFLLTPLFLPVEDFPGIGDHELIGDLLEWANPVAPFVESVRTILWAGEAPEPAHLVYVAGAGLLSLALGVLRLPPDGARPGGGPVSPRAARSCSSAPRARSRSCTSGRGRSRSSRSRSAAGGRAACTRCATSTFTSRRARRSGWSAATAPARRRSFAASRASCRSTRGGRSAAGAWSRCSSWAPGSARTSPGARTSG